MDRATRALAAMDRRPIVTLVVMAGILLSIRVVGILDESFWWDEASTASLTLLSPWEIVAWSAGNQNPPLYFLLVSGWSSVLGVSEISLRSFSLLLSVATGLVLFRLARNHLGREAALFTFLLYAGSGIGLYYAQEARSYTLTALLCSISFSLYLDLFQRSRASRAALLGLTNLAAVFVHFTIIPVLLAQPLVAVLCFRKKARALKLYVVSQLVAVLTFLPWMGNLIRNTPVSGEYWLAPPGLEAIFEGIVTLVGGPIPAALSGVFLLAVALIALAGRFKMGVDRETRWILALWWLLPIGFAAVVGQWFPIFAPRYLLATTLAFFLVEAALLAALPLSLVGRLALAGAIAVAGLLAPQPVDYLKPDWRAAATRIESLRVPWASVAVTPGGRCLPLAWYLLPESFAEIRPAGAESLRDEKVFCLSGDADMEALAASHPSRLVLVVGRGDFLRPEAVLQGVSEREWSLRERWDLEGVVVLRYERGS